MNARRLVEGGDDWLASFNLDVEVPKLVAIDFRVSYKGPRGPVRLVRESQEMRIRSVDTLATLSVVLKHNWYQYNTHSDVKIIEERLKIRSVNLDRIDHYFCQRL